MKKDIKPQMDLIRTDLNTAETRWIIKVATKSTTRAYRQIEKSASFVAKTSGIYRGMMVKKLRFYIAQKLHQRLVEFLWVFNI